MNINITPAVKFFLLLNVGLFALAIFAGYSMHIDLNALLGLYPLQSEHFRVYQFVTYMFMHAFTDGQGGIYFMHILGNMFALFMFGPMLERVWGSKRFIVFYLVTGIGAGLFYWGIDSYNIYQVQSQASEYIAHPTPEHFAKILREHDKDLYDQNAKYIFEFSQHPDNEQMIKETVAHIRDWSVATANIEMVGASGAVFGILMAFGMLFPNTELMLLFPPIPIKAKYFVTFYGLFELYSHFQHVKGDNVAHFAHLAGMLFAFILVKYWNSKPDRFY